MTTTQDADKVRAARQEIVAQLDNLSLDQLDQVLALIGVLRGLPKGMNGQEFDDLLQALSTKHRITNEEWEEFDRILREAREAERRRLAADSHA